jgi:hypothetical protein
MAFLSVLAVMVGGLNSAILMRSNRKFSVRDLEEVSLVSVIMVITALILGLALTSLVGAEVWPSYIRGFYILGLAAIGFLAEDWLERKIADGDPLKNQSVERR